MQNVIRVLVAKPGLDGHDRGAKVVARGLRDAGFEVIYTGLHQTPEMVVNAALQEDVDVIGLSILSGAHIPLVEAIQKLMKKKSLAKPIFVGGIIPGDDAKRLFRMGIAAVFGPGSSLQDIAEKVRAVAMGEVASAANANKSRAESASSVSSMKSKAKKLTVKESKATATVKAKPKAKATTKATTKATVKAKPTATATTKAKLKPKLPSAQPVRTISKKVKAKVRS